MALIDADKAQSLAEIVIRINEIDSKIGAAEPWLRRVFIRDMRERELLVELANKKFDAKLKHEWR